MAIGMESAGFELLMANEVSPMASETFAYNVLGLELSKPVNSESSTMRISSE